MACLNEDYSPWLLNNLAFVASPTKRHLKTWFNLAGWRMLSWLGSLASTTTTTTTGCGWFSWWWFQIFFIFPPYYLGKWSNLTSIFFQMGWFNHHLVLNAVVFARTALEEEWRLNTLRTPFGTKKQPGGSSKLDHGWVQITDQSMICWNLIGMNVHGKKTSSQANRDDMKGTETRSFCMFLSSRNDWWVQRISFDATDCLRPAMEAKFPIEAPNSFLWRIKQNGIFPLLVLVPERFIRFNFGVNFLGWKEFHWTPFSSAWHAKRYVSTHQSYLGRCQCFPTKKEWEHVKMMILMEWLPFFPPCP